MKAKLLCVGDLHLGRRPVHLPEDLSEHGLAPTDLAPSAGWRAVVARAKSERVDAVLLAGDVVESDNRYFEAFGALETGVRELVAAGIPVIAVAGNHDVEVLPRLAREIDGFQLLGVGGEWQERTLERDGRKVVRVIGWSFPVARVEASPFASPSFARCAASPSLTTLGLLHCDLGASASPYAPVSARELADAPVDAWLLGHVHAPSLSSGPRPTGYLGSVVGLDPTETGPHGPWLATIDSDSREGRSLELVHVPLAPLRWESLEIALQGDVSAEDVEARIVRSLDELAARISASAHRPLAVGCRIRLTGRIGDPRGLRRGLADTRPESLRRLLGGTLYFVDRVENAATAELDLHELARATDPSGRIARMLLALRAEPLSDEARVWIKRSSRDVARVVDRSAWSVLGAVDTSDDTQRARLVAAGNRALEELLAQRVESSAHG
ncbi:MAG: exonuclease SbcCD subunit D [Planctomycetota bacterium]